MSFDMVKRLRSSISNVFSSRRCSGGRAASPLWRHCAARWPPTLTPVNGAEIAVLVVAAVFTSTLSGIAGFGGGVVLLGVLLIFLPPLEAVPVHGAIQIAANSSRALALWSHVKGRIVAFHLGLLVPASALGLAAASAMPVDLGRALIGVFALVAAWRPAWITPRLERPLPDQAFLAVGALQGFVNVPLGATGPLITPFFRVSLDGRLAFVATFAAAQTAGHIVKVGVFAVDGFDYTGHATTIALGAVAVVAGSIIGTRLLGKVSEPVFRVLFLVVLTAIAARLIIVAII